MVPSLLPVKAGGFFYDPTTTKQNRSKADPRRRENEVGAVGSTTYDDVHQDGKT